MDTQNGCVALWKSMGLEIKSIDLPRMSCGNISQVVNLSEPQFLPLYNGDKHIHIIGVL